MKTQEESQLQDINKAAKVLKSGGVVIFPTDTVYGIGCIYNDQRAVDRVYKIKGTEKTQAFPILVSSIQQVEKVAALNQLARNLIEKFWPGGLTIVLKKKAQSSSRHPELVSGSKVGFRMPNSDLIKALIKKTGSPIIGTSANFHTHKTPRSYDELDPEVIKLADYVIKGECKLGRESTVVDITTNPPKILRQGAVQLDDLPAGRQVLKIDTTKTEAITVNLEDKKTGKKTKLIEKQKFGSQVLLPLIVKILKSQKADFKKISEVQVNPGPGSFTGTRVGTTVANVLGFALNIPVNGKKKNIVLPKYEKSKFD